jgi:uncharacterized protein YfcZ (UPF0381/DUF406 family)
MYVDVVAAYKNLQKEKDALESTVRILTSKDESTTSNPSTVNSTTDEVIVHL